jgi:hypothetical protein
MSLMSLGYRELGIELVSLEENCSHTPKQYSIMGENKYDGTIDPFKMLHKESFERERNEMMGKFSQILRRLPKIYASTSNGFTTPFKLQINFDIPIFEGQIDVDVLEKWLNVLEGYHFVHNFSYRETITFSLLKALPHVKVGERLSMRKRK